MIRRVFIISAMLMLAVCTWAAHEVAAPQNIFARKCVSLNGAWHYLADPQEQGYYDYWMHPVRWGYFRNAKPQRPSDLIEYDFDASPTMQVPGDWNTQDERLFMYEGSVWFCREFQVSGFKFQVKAVVSFNQYVGWYRDVHDAPHMQWEIPYDKPVIVSEFGGGAKAGLHGDVDQRRSEEFQERLYRENLAMLEKIDGLAGTCPWVLKDFRKPRRLLPGIQDIFDRKVLYSDQGQRKKASYILQEWYQKR
jgi:hypothetical protein